MSNENDAILAKDVSSFLKSLKVDVPAHPHSVQPKHANHKHKKTAVPTSGPQHVKLPGKVSLKPDSTFIFQPSSKWYTALPLLDVNPRSSDQQVTADQLASKTKRAGQLHSNDVHTFQSSSASNSAASEAGFLFKIIQSGTLSDRLSALTLLIQSSPLHNVKALESLKTMAERGKGKGGREESLKALRCIVDWWVGGGAPGRKLKYFRDQPLLHPSVTDQYLVAWYFEDWLKKYFFSILQILEVLSLDPLPYIRTQVISLIFTLLRDKPEQEQNLLRLLVNKLGDTEKSICSRASYQLLQLLQTHPAMKSVVVRDIIALVLKPSAVPVAPTASDGLPKGAGKHIRFTDNEEKSNSKPKPLSSRKINGNAHARYYSMITLNQIVLMPNDRGIARQLLDVYFEVFKEVLGERADDEDGKSRGDVEEVSISLDKAGRAIVGGRKGEEKRKERHHKEVKGAAGFTEVEDANAKLVSAALTGVNRALPYAKVSTTDENINKHIDTLFLITHTSTSNISLQALVLIQQIASSLSSSSNTSSPVAKPIKDRYYRALYASLHDSRLSTSSKQAMYLNLLFKSIKADADNMDRVVALVRRFVQVLVSGGNGATEVIAGGLYLLGELFSSVPGLRSTIHQAAKLDGEPYDSRKREPLFAHARSSPLWELTPLLHHYHPAVSLHARQLLTSQPITASPDLTQNTLSHFLDRFVYKNPKKNKAGESGAKPKGASAMQPAASALDGQGVKIMKTEADSASLRLNETAFLKQKELDIPVDQIFFHRYFTRKSERAQAKAAKIGKKKLEADVSETDEEGDDEAQVSQGDSDDEKEIWKAMKASIPKASGDEDALLEDSEDSDAVPSSLDMSDGEAWGGDEEEENDSDTKDEALALVEASDDEDLVSLDADLPEGLIEYDGEDGSEGGEWGGIDSRDAGKKRKRKEEKKERQKRLRSLPTFASYEEYAKMIEDGPEDDI